MGILFYPMGIEMLGKGTALGVPRIGVSSSVRRVTSICTCRPREKQRD